MLDDARYTSPPGRRGAAGLREPPPIARGGPAYRLHRARSATRAAPVPMIAYAETLTMGRMVNQEIARRKLAARHRCDRRGAISPNRCRRMVRQSMGLAWLPRPADCR